MPSVKKSNVPSVTGALPVVRSVILVPVDPERDPPHKIWVRRLKGLLALESKSKWR